MKRLRKKKPIKYRFKIDAYSPETMPLSVLADVSPAGKNVLEFPVKEVSSLSYGPIKQLDTFDGIPVRVGGKKKDKAAVHLEPRGGGDIIVCTTSRTIAKQIAHHIFTKVIRVEGVGRWTRHPDGQWEMLSFKIASFDPLTDESEISLRESIDKLRAIPAAWKDLDDPVSELLRIRYGTEDSTAESAHNGHSPEG